jgi:hypothetical protein
MIHPRFPHRRRRWPALFGVLVLAIGVPALAQDNPPKTADDPVFDRYVDLSLLASAWEEKDVEVLTDIGLQLAEGERVLMRAHKGIGSDQVFAAALKVAAERKDKAGLARLTKVLIALKRGDLVAEAKRAKQLADASRTVDPALIVAVDATAPEAFMLLKDTLEAIGSAKIGQNAKGLDAIAKEVPKMTELTEPQRRALLKLAKEAQAQLPKDAKEVDPIAATLNKLAGESRRPGGGGSPSRPGGGSGRPGGGGGNPGRGPRGNAPRNRSTAGPHWHRQFSSRHNRYIYWDGDYGCWYIYDDGCGCYTILDDGD